MNLSIVIVSYKSDHLIENIILSCPSNFEIIIIENSINKQLKTKLENKYSNVKVILPNENLGYGSAINLALYNSKNNYVFCLSPDVEINKNCFDEIVELLKKFNNFTILAPTYLDDSIHKNYGISDILKKKANIKIEKFILKQVSEIDGAAFLINKSNLDSIKIMDENFFLYFESTDMCMNLIKQGKKLFVIDNLKFNHLGTSSSDLSIKNEISLNRNWHYAWSKFYLFRKHYNYLYGLKKTLKNFFHSLKWFSICRIKYIYSKQKKDKMDFDLHKAILLGLVNSYFLRKSSYRPLNEINKEKN